VKDIYAENEERAYLLARRADASGADAVLLSGTGLPTVAVLEMLERDLGKPVISSNQACLWQALRLAGVREAIPGFGRLLRETDLSKSHPHPTLSLSEGEGISCPSPPMKIPALVIPGDDPAHATSGAHYLREMLPQSDYWP
jgi:hypothetical protein